MLCTWFPWTPRALTLAEVKRRREGNVSRLCLRNSRSGIGQISFIWVSSFFHSAPKNTFHFRSVALLPKKEWPKVAPSLRSNRLYNFKKIFSLWTKLIFKRNFNLKGLTRCDKLLPGVTNCCQVWRTGFRCDQVVKVVTSWSHLLLLQQSNNEDFWGTGTSKIGVN